MKKSFFARFLKSKQIPEKTTNTTQEPVKTVEENKPQQVATNQVETKEQAPEPKQETIQPTNTQEGQLTIDVFQTPEDIVIKSTIAGVKPEDIDVNIDNDMVTIRGERKSEVQAKEEDYYYQECYWGAFSRSVILPIEVDADCAQAELKNGILTVKLPKINQLKTKKIQVKPAES